MVGLHRTMHTADVNEMSRARSPQYPRGPDIPHMNHFATMLRSLSLVDLNLFTYFLHKLHKGMISCGKPYQLSQCFKEFSIATICIWTEEKNLDILNYIDCIEHAIRRGTLREKATRIHT